MDKLLEFLGNLKHVLALDYRSLAIIAMVSSCIALAPSGIIHQWNLQGFWSPLRPWAFLVSMIATVWLMAALLLDLASNAYAKLQGWKSNRELTMRRTKLIHNLSRVEKEVLARYVLNDTTTVAFDFRDGIVNGLIGEEILYRASTASNPFTAADFDVNIQPWAWEYLQSHPDVLAEITPTKSKRHHINLT